MEISPNMFWVLSFNLKDLMLCVCRQIFDDVFPHIHFSTQNSSHLLFTCTQYFNHFNIRIHETKSFLPIYCLIKNHFQLNFSAAIFPLSSYSICNSTSPLKHKNFFFLSFLTLENLAGSMSELYSSLDADFTAWNSTRMRNKCFPADVPLLQHHDIGISYG